MSEQGSISRWIGELRAGRSDAATQLWQRYYNRLVNLARQKLGAMPRHVADEEDVVVDAFDTFCRGVNAGRFPKLEDRDDLWQVLVMLTARKAINQAKHGTRQKRSQPLTITPGGGALAEIDEIIGTEPSPAFAAEVVEQCRELLEKLDDDSLRGVAVAKMEGYRNAEIAQQMGVQTRTIERKLRLIRELWSNAMA